MRTATFKKPLSLTFWSHGASNEFTKIAPQNMITREFMPTPSAYPLGEVVRKTKQEKMEAWGG
jgi:hypothetical protein